MLPKPPRKVQGFVFDRLFQDELNILGLPIPNCWKIVRAEISGILV
jgi:hypothetical protein